MTLNKNYFEILFWHETLTVRKCKDFGDYMLLWTALHNVTKLSKPLVVYRF